MLAFADVTRRGSCYDIDCSTWIVRADSEYLRITEQRVVQVEAVPLRRDHYLAG